MMNRTVLLMKNAFTSASAQPTGTTRNELNKNDSPPESWNACCMFVMLSDARNALDVAEHLGDSTGVHAGSRSHHVGIEVRALDGADFTGDVNARACVGPCAPAVEGEKEGGHDDADQIDSERGRENDNQILHCEKAPCPEIVVPWLLLKPALKPAAEQDAACGVFAQRAGIDGAHFAAVPAACRRHDGRRELRILRNHGLHRGIAERVGDVEEPSGFVNPGCA